MAPEGETGRQRMEREVEVMQLQLSPAHPDFGKVGFAELEDRVRTRAYQLYEKKRTRTRARP
jgi:hypothetical protein